MNFNPKKPIDLKALYPISRLLVMDAIPWRYKVAHGSMFYQAIKKGEIPVADLIRPSYNAPYYLRGQDVIKLIALWDEKALKGVQPNGHRCHNCDKPLYGKGRKWCSSKCKVHYNYNQSHGK